MNSKNVQIMFILLAVGVLLIGENICQASNSRPPRNNEISTMADALKYLQDLDSYYGDKARVRFGKRNPMPQLLRDHINDFFDTNQRLLDFPSSDEPF